MINIGKVDFGVSAQPTPNPRETTPAAETESPRTDQAKGITVTLSLEGMRKSDEAGGAEKAANKDIDDSELPPIIKQMLKTIRAMRKQLAEKKEELAQLMANKSLDEEQKMAQAKVLQSAIQTLGTAITNTQNGLAKAAKEQKLTAEQSAQMLSLSMR